MIRTDLIDTKYLHNAIQELINQEKNGVSRSHATSRRTQQKDAPNQGHQC